MSAALKCPNPSCPFLFDPTQVPPGAMLTCPRCGMRFTLGPTPGGPPPGAYQQPPPGYGAPPGYPGHPAAGGHPQTPGYPPQPGYPQQGYAGAPPGYPGFPQPPAPGGMPPGYGPPQQPPPGYGAPPPQPSYGQPGGYGAPAGNFPGGPAGNFPGGPPGYGPGSPATGGAPKSEDQLAFSDTATATAEPSPRGNRKADPYSEERQEAIRERASKQGSGILTVLIAVGGVLVIGGVLAAVMISKRGLVQKATPTREIRNVDYNFALSPPPSGWELDEETKRIMDLNVVAYHRSGPEGWVAFAARDYKDRSPRPAELRDRMMEILYKGFDNLPESGIDAKPNKVNGYNGLQGEFRGTSKTTGEEVVGEVSIIENKGIAYWIFGWSTARDASSAAKEISDIRSGLKLLDHRDKWAPKRSAERIFRNKNQNYGITDWEGIWDYPKSPRGVPIDPLADPDYSKQEDGKCELLLFGVLKTSSNRGQKQQATSAVMLVEGSGEPKDVAADYIKARYKKLFQDAEVNLIERNSEPEGDPAPDPADSGTKVYRAQLSVTSGGGKIQKLIAYSAIPVDGKVAFVEVSCPWKDREAWEFRMIQIASTLK